MLSSATEAEDLVQEVWLRWQTCDRGAVANPAGRPLVSRARKRGAGEKRTPVTAGAQEERLTTFVAAARSGDTEALERLFAAEVTSLSDGNGMRGASRIPVVGAVTVAKYYRSFAARFWPGVDVAWASLNGQAAALLSR